MFDFDILNIDRDDGYDDDNSSSPATVGVFISDD